MKNEKNIVYLRTSTNNSKGDAPTINSLNKDRYLFGNTMDIKKILRVAAYAGGEEKKPLIEMNAITPFYKPTSVQD